VNFGGGVLRAVGLVVGSSVVASVLGFVKGVLAASYFGTSGIMDGYLIALLLPDLVARFALTGVFNFVPVFANEWKVSQEQAWRAASKMVTYWLSLLFVIMVVATVFADAIVPLLAPGFEGQQLVDAVRMCRALFLMAASVGLAEILTQPLIAQRRFFTHTLSETSFQITSTLFLVVFHSWGIDALVWGMVFGGCVQLAIAAFGMREFKDQLRIDLRLKHPVVGQMMKLTLPTYVGTAGARLNSIINRAFASLLPVGAVSSLQYAYTLTEAPVSLLASPATRALFPFLAGQFAEDEKRARANLSRAIFSIALVFAPVAVGSYLLAGPIVKVLFERGSFDAQSTVLTSAALEIYAPCIFAMALSRLLAIAFTARMDTATPMKVGLLRIAINGVLCYSLIDSLGHRGIALSNTLAETVKVVVLMGLLWRSFPREEAIANLRPFAKLVPALGAMALVVQPLTGALPAQPTLLAAACLSGIVVLGALVYFAAAAALCREEARFLWEIVRDSVPLPGRIAALIPGRARP